MKVITGRVSYGLTSIIVALSLVFYGLQPLTAKAQSVPVTVSETAPTDTTVAVPQGGTDTTVSTPSDINTTVSPTPTPTDPATPPPADQTPQPAADPSQNVTTPGPQQPTGDAFKTYVFNEATGLWENDYYTWNPVARIRPPPKGAVDYSYNPVTGRWDTTQWVYDAASGNYQPNVISVATAPVGMENLPVGDTPLALFSAPSLLSSGLESPTNSSVLNGISNNSKPPGCLTSFITPTSVITLIR